MLLSVTDLVAGYGAKSVIQGVSLEVGEREVVGIIGHNGAGKSTLLNAIFGVLRPIAGRVSFAGADITGRKPSLNVSAGIGYAPQGAEVFKSLSVAENLMLGGFAINDRQRVADGVERVEALFPILRERRHQRAGALSGGERQMLAMGMLLVAQPKLVILDEPSGGLSPLMVYRMYAAIREIATKLGASVLLVEQDLGNLLNVADRVYALANGRRTFAGSPDELRSNEAMSRVMLGY